MYRPGITKERQKIKKHKKEINKEQFNALQVSFLEQQLTAGLRFKFPLI